MSQQGLLWGAMRPSVCVCTPACVHVCARLLACVCVRACACTLVCVYTCLCVCVCACACMPACVSVFTCVCMCVWSGGPRLLPPRFCILLAGALTLSDQVALVPRSRLASYLVLGCPHAYLHQMTSYVNNCPAPESPFCAFSLFPMDT